MYQVFINQLKSSLYLSPFVNKTHFFLSKNKKNLNSNGKNIMILLKKMRKVF